jgi:hypothetical protein
MSPIDLIAILALVGYAVYKQTQVSEVTAKSRFKLAIIYGAVGLCVGGINPPSGVAGVALLGFGLALSVVVGLARGRLTRIWIQADGRVFKQGTALTVGLFLAMIAIKFGTGAWAQFAHVDDGEGFGEVLVMMALMIAVQAELMWRRAQALIASAPVQSELAPAQRGV